MSLYQKYRPQTFDFVVGQKKEVAMLRNLFEKEEHPHSFIFSGAVGCGKTTMARILANMVATESSVYEYNSANDRGIDTIREIQDLTLSPSILGGSTVVILDEYHMGTTQSQNALLKLLEDAPKFMYYFICTTEPSRLIPAIHSRCFSVSFTPLSEDEIYSLLRRVKKEEGLEVPPTVLNTISEVCEGVPRDALVLLEGVGALSDEKSMLEYVGQHSATGDSVEAIDLCRAIYNGRSWAEQSKMLDGLSKSKTDPEKLRRMILSYISKTLLYKVDDRNAKKMSCFTDNLFNTGFPGLVLQCYKACGISRGFERMEDVF